MAGASLCRCSIDHGAHLNQPVAAAADIPSVSLLELTLVLLRSKWLVLATGFLGGIAGYGVSFLMTPLYRANVVLVAASQDAGGGSSLAGRLGGLAAIAGIGNLGSGSSRVEAFEYLKSRQIVADLITEENLLPVLFSEYWDPKAKAWTVPESEIPTLDEGIREFDDRVREVTEDKRAGIIELAIVWRDRHLAARWANGLVARANAALRHQAVTEAQKSIHFLNAEAAKSPVVEVQQAIYRLVEDQFKSITAASVRDQYAFRIVDPARVPEARRPKSPRRVLMAILGAFAFGAGCSLVLWVRHFRGRFRQP